MENPFDLCEDGYELGPLVLIQTLGWAVDEVMFSSALLGLLHGRPAIPSHRKKTRTKHSERLESSFQAMGWILSQTGFVRYSTTDTMSPKYFWVHISPTCRCCCTELKGKGKEEPKGPGEVMELGNYLSCLREKHEQKLEVNGERF